MKKLTSLLMFVGLAFNVSAQEEPKNLKEAFKADWLIGTWESTNDDGQVSGQTFGWKIQDVLIVRESKGNDGEVQGFGIISLDVDEDKVLYHSFNNRYASIGEIKFEGQKMIRTSTWKSKKLSEEQIQSRVESIVANQLASGSVQEADVPQLKQGIRNYFQRTSGTRKYTYEKQGENKLLMTRASKNTSGEFVERDPVTLTRKRSRCTP